MSLTNDKVFKVSVRDRESLLFEGSVIAISSQNSLGPFDILAEHTPFITSLQTNITLLLPDHQEKSFKTGFGVIHVNQEDTKIFIGL